MKIPLKRKYLTGFKSPKQSHHSDVGRRDDRKSFVAKVHAATWGKPEKKNVRGR